MSRLLSAASRIQRFPDGSANESDHLQAASPVPGLQPAAVFSAIIEIISNMTAAPTIAVMLFELSFVGIMQTTSPPIMFNPRAA